MGRARKAVEGDRFERFAEPGGDERQRRLAAAVDGRVVALSGNRLLVYDGTPALVGRLDLPHMSPESLVVANRRALVVGRKPPQGIGSGPAPRAGTWDEPEAAPILLSQIDLADPNRPRLIATQTVDATGFDLRLDGSVARLITSRFPQLGLASPRVERAGDPAAIRARNAAIVRRAGLSVWLGSRSVSDANGRESIDGYVTACPSIHDVEGAGPMVTTVQTFDLGRADALTAGTSMGLIGNGTLHASSKRLYVAEPNTPRAGRETIVALRAGAAPETAWEKTVAVSGYLPRVGGLSERDGRLRVVLNDRALPERPSDGSRRIGRGSATVAMFDEELRPGRRIEDAADGRLAVAVRWLGDGLAVRAGDDRGPTHYVDLRDSVARGVLPGTEPYTYLSPTDGDTVVALRQSAHPLVGEDATTKHAGLSVATLRMRDGTLAESGYYDLGLGRAEYWAFGRGVLSDPQRRVLLVGAVLDTGVSCPAEGYCTSGGDEIEAECRALLKGCSSYGNAAQTPVLQAFRVGADGSLTPTGRWNGGEVSSILRLPDRLVVLSNRVVALDPVTLRPLGTAAYPKR